MYRCLLLSILLLTLSGFASAGEAASGKDSSKSQPVQAKTSVALVGSPELISQKDTLFMAPSESKTIGVLVDYRPFSSSGFNLSAGSVTNNQTSSFQTVPPVQRAYLGVGWKRLLDDAQNFGIRVDVGAIYDDHPELENRSSNLNSSNDVSQSIAPSEWIPVVSLGVSYRF